MQVVLVRHQDAGDGERDDDDAKGEDGVKTNLLLQRNPDAPAEV